MGVVEWAFGEVNARDLSRVTGIFAAAAVH